HDGLPAILLKFDAHEKDFEHKAVDVVIRDIMNDIPGLVESDRLIERLLAIIKNYNNRGLDDAIGTNAQRADKNTFFLDELSDLETAKLAPFLGSKAKNLIYLRNSGFNVPPGVVLSSLYTNRNKEYMESPEFVSILKRIVKHLEDKTGAIFGSGRKPLFLSVRSGSYISMPGILSSILYCGMNNRTFKALEKNTGNPMLARDAYRRFLEHYATVVFGLDPIIFESIMNSFMAQKGGAKHDKHGSEQLQHIIRLYLEELTRRGLSIPEDVYEQLRMSIRAVYASWQGTRATSYRRAVAMSGHWGTAVTLMQMVYGNEAGSGASVFFTRHPLSYERNVYGETREESTGDDIVSGKQNSRPLARSQSRNDQHSLEETDPKLFTLHQDFAKKIEDAMGGLPQEVELAYIRGRRGKRILFALQSRRMDFGGNNIRTFSEICRMESRIIGRGIGAHGGALSGIASFASSIEQVMQLRKKTLMPIILLRKTANTDDVTLMPVVRGIITASGGVTSHAAMLAQKFDVTTVLMCSSLVLNTTEQGEPYATLGDVVIKEGTLISMDGASGLIFSGMCLNTTAVF
ncbi:MAG TPA: PEP/pyruvate-binding domain-containing protein, partial [Nitrospirota bacterium]|nr:PEP/pyruvate-binding domain-containing protein [Nitrospirota bacterium]